MLNKLSSVLIFALGAAIGSVVTWKLIERKYEQRYQEEVASFKEVQLRKKDDEHAKEISKIYSTITREKPDVLEYAARLKDHGYTDYSKGDPPEEDVQEGKNIEPVPKSAIYVIPPYEFGDIDEYETISLVYYSDQILSDDMGSIIENIEEIVGFEALGRFGEYEDDSVFVKNDILKCYYEILLDKQRYVDMVARKPHEVD